MASGVYCLQSKIKPERFYIGSTNNVDKRKSQHFQSLNKNTHHSIKIRNHINKYGSDDIEFFVLEECEVNVLIEREQFYIDILNPFFNCRKIADSNIGRKHTAEEIKNKSDYMRSLYKNNQSFKDKMSLASKKRWDEDSYRNKIVSAIRDRCGNDEYKEKLSNSHMGLKWSEKRYISDAKMEKTKGSSKYWGVCIFIENKKTRFSASVTVNSKTKQLGRFNSEIEAAIAREHYILCNGMKYQKLNKVSSSGE